jgi:hypothetical protein
MSVDPRSLQRELSWFAAWASLVLRAEQAPSRTRGGQRAAEMMEPDEATGAAGGPPGSKSGDS